MNRRDRSRTPARLEWKWTTLTANLRTATARRTTVMLSLTAIALAATPAIATAGAAEPTPTARQETRAQESQEPPVEMRRYTVRRGSHDTAWVMAQTLCQEARYNASEPSEVRCSVEGGDGSLIFLADAEMHERFNAELAELDVPPRTHRFHIAVLEAVEGDGMPDDLHEGAIQALEDLRSFLPYSGFRTMASGWLEAAHQGATKLPGSGNFELEIVFQGDPKDGNTLVVDHFQLSATPLSPQEIRAYEQAGQNPPSRDVLQSNFSIDVGETKVLGTSKLNGDGQALVVLFTVVE